MNQSEFITNLLGRRVRLSAYARGMPLFKDTDVENQGGDIVAVWREDDATNPSTVVVCVSWSGSICDVMLHCLQLQP